MRFPFGCTPPQPHGDIPFHSIRFRPIAAGPVPFHSIPRCSIAFRAVPFHPPPHPTVNPFHSIAFRPNPCGNHSVPFHDPGPCGCSRSVQLVASFVVHHMGWMERDGMNDTRNDRCGLEWGSGFSREGFVVQLINMYAFEIPRMRLDEMLLGVEVGMGWV